MEILLRLLEVEGFEGERNQARMGFELGILKAGLPGVNGTTHGWRSLTVGKREEPGLTIHNDEELNSFNNEARRDTFFQFCFDRSFQG